MVPEDEQFSASLRNHLTDTRCIVSARAPLQGAFDETNEPFFVFLYGHPGPDCDPRAHLQDIFDQTISSLRGDAPIAARALQSALNASASLTSDRRAMTMCIQALERSLEVWSSDIEAMTLRVHALERSQEV